MELICLFITLAIFSSYYYLLSSQHSEGVLYKLLTSSVLSCAQIILSELFLGLLHQLYLPLLIAVNLSMAGLVAAMGGRRIRMRGAKFLRNDVVRIREAAGTALDGPAVALGMLAVLTYAWILAAAYFLPPRGLDDTVYHLPAIFEYVQSHEIRLLPLDMLWPFAYPENAELLFLWPVIFCHAQRWVDGANVPFVLLSVATVYALLRHFAVRQRDAFFAALLYALCPVVLMQAGVNYVDIIVSLFLLLSLYYSILFNEHRRPRDLYIAGLSMGLMCGMKYTALFLVLPLQALIIPALGKGRWRHGIGYAAVIAFAGGWWYLRNAIVLGDPLFPMQILSSLPRAVRGTQGGSITQNILYNIPFWISRYPLADAGVGGYDGGFGLIFWGMGFSSWLYVTVRSLFTIRRTRFPIFVLLAYLPLGLLLLLMMPPQWVDLNGRFSVFMVAIGLFALCEVLRSMQDEGFISIIKGLCIVLSMVTITLLSVSYRPSYRLMGALSDAINHAEASEFKYLADSISVHAALRPAWEALDLLTRDDADGLNCGVAATPDHDFYVLSPVYGSKLQNRLLNMEANVAARADAYICAYAGDPLDRTGSARDEGQQLAVTIRNIMSKDDFVAVLRTDNVFLTLRRGIFNRPDKQRVLLNYYRTYWPEAVDSAEELDGRIAGDIPVITSSEIGYGVRSVDMRRERPNRVLLSFENREEEVASLRKVKECYTFQRPLSGYRSRKVAQVVYKGREFDVFLNRRS